MHCITALGKDKETIENAKNRMGFLIERPIVIRDNPQDTIQNTATSMQYPRYRLIRTIGEITALLRNRRLTCIYQIRVTLETA